jgi:hypothetical protein
MLIIMKPNIQAYKFIYSLELQDWLCGLVVRVPNYRSKGSRFSSRHYEIFWDTVGLVHSASWA